MFRGTTWSCVWYMTRRAGGISVLICNRKSYPIDSNGARFYRAANNVRCRRIATCARRDYIIFGFYVVFGRILSPVRPPSRQGLGAKRPISTVTPCRRTRCFGVRLFIYFFFRYSQTTADLQEYGSLDQNGAVYADRKTIDPYGSLRLFFYLNRVKNGGLCTRWGGEGVLRKIIVITGLLLADIALQLHFRACRPFMGTRVFVPVNRAETGRPVGGVFA